ncbi:MAG: hypothetical protein R2695_00440 [Acidimicrobiales bacterium]
MKVNEAAVAPHLGHGDALVGDIVPGMASFRFDDNCAPVSDCDITTEGELRQAVTMGGAYTICDSLLLTGGQLLVDTSVTLMSAGPDNAVIDGGGSSRVFFIDGAGGALTLTNITVTGGGSSGNINGSGAFNAGGTILLNGTSCLTGNSSNFGGGISNQGGHIILNDASCVSDNSAAQDGGGIYNFSGGIIEMNDSSFISGNDALFGGGISNHGGQVVMTGGAFISNNSSMLPGGGVWNLGGTLSGVTVGDGGNVFDNVPDNLYQQ